jgi:N-carbamoyl-L-amino-acid hydrolase
MSKENKPSELRINASRLEGLLRRLSEIGKDPSGGTTRIAFSEEDRAGREWIIDKMREAGLEVWVDEVANIHGRRPGSDPDVPAILFGSHIDTVPQGGNFDGCLGSLGALEAVSTLEDEGLVTRHPLEMVIWSDEEGAHFGMSFFGSRAATFGLEPHELDITDDERISQAEWLRRYGLNPDRIGRARLDRTKTAAYLELHVEQGPRLFREDVQIGIVEGIVGINRYDVTIEGAANHAGTTPMDERRDALIAASKLILAVREEIVARPGRQVGNVGFVNASPGAPNVIPGRVRMPIELRDLDQAVIETMMKRIEGRAASIAREAEVSIDIQLTWKEEPTLTDSTVRDIIENVAKTRGFSTLRMPSGAGHDAQILARFGVPSGMIFVPSKDGVSHSPREWTEWEDCARGVEVLYRSILALDEV